MTDKKLLRQAAKEMLEYNENSIPGWDVMAAGMSLAAVYQEYFGIKW